MINYPKSSFWKSYHLGKHISVPLCSKESNPNGKVYHYRNSSGLEIDAVVELPDETFAAFEIKLGSASSIDEAARNLQKFLTRLVPEKANQCTSLNILIAGSSSYTRKNNVNVVSLGHLFV